jgi:S1-C subfamily serine protease
MCLERNRKGGKAMTQVLLDLSNALVANVKAVEPSLARVEARRRQPASGVVWSAEGLVVTAHHVIKRDNGISVGLSDGQTVAATLVGRDPSTDLALLRTEAQDLTPPTWAEADALAVGHPVLAVARPGLTVQATLGIVSALGGSWRTRRRGQVDHYLQTDVLMYPGFSGSALVDAAGQVVGVNTSALVRGASVALPTTTVRRVVETLLTHGRVRRSYLGVRGQPVHLPRELAEQLKQKTGMLLLLVEPDSPAGRGGLNLGDTIVALDDQPVRHPDDLLAFLDSTPSGAVQVRILRGGQVQELEVVFEERK